MDYLFKFILFLAEAITVVVAIVFVVASIISLSTKGRERTKDQISVKNISNKFIEMKEILQSEILDKKQLKEIEKKRKAKEKEEKNKEETKPRSFVINFDGDTEASQVENLREEITAILTVAEKEDEVVICLESPGGMVHTYGLAASQINRIKQKEIPLTIIVDKVAASGGYLMACIADKLKAAPFAIIGSIGVVMQLPNFNKVLKKYDVDYEMITAGEYKRTLTVLGENTEKARVKAKEEVDEVHDLFKGFVNKYRPELDLTKVATGEHWFGQQALELGLIDEIETSDDYLMSISEDREIFEVTKVEKLSLKEKLAATADLSFNKIWNSFFKKNSTNIQ
ncbi:MAG: protease SohB [Gammaproteobacteria bacterium]|nr:MAG: protease SohB [Gammaproteobacteria bacterium]